MTAAMQTIFEEFCEFEALGERASADNCHATTYGVCCAFRKAASVISRRFEEGLLEHYQKKVSVYVDFCANDELNAFAAKDSSGAYLVGINSGALGILGQVLTDLFADEPQWVRDLTLGDVSAHYAPAQIATNVAYFAACHFLISHELGHIAYGHTDLLADQYQSNKRIAESNSLIVDEGLQPELFQAMEVDADLFATTSLVASIANGRLFGYGLDPLMTEPSEIMRISIVSIFVMMHLFYGENVTIESYKRASHPLPEVRLLKACMRMDQLGNVMPSVKKLKSILADPVIATTKLIPDELQDQLFPSWRHSGSANLLAENMRVRKAEDQFQEKLARYSLIPVGGVVL